MKLLSRKLIAVGNLLLGVSPVFLLLGAWLMPGAPAVMLAPPALFLAMSAPCALLPARKRLPVALAACAALSGLYTLIFLPRLGLPALAVLPPCALLALLPLPALSRPDGRVYAESFWYWCAGLHLASRVASRLMLLPAADGALRVAFIVFFVCMLLGLNSATVRDGVGGGDPPRRLSSRNRLAALLLAALALIIANLGAVRAALAKAWELVLRVVAAIIDFLSSFMPEQSPPGEGGGGGMQGMGLEAGEPSALARILEQIAKYLALAACVALALLALWFLGKKLKKLLIKLLSLLRAYAARVGESYEDTVESLFDWGEVAAAAREKARKLVARREKPLPWSALDSRARVRRAFQTLKKRKPGAPASRTARELLSSGALPVPPDAAPRMADIYDAARYSSRDIGAEDAQFMKEKSGV